MIYSRIKHLSQAEFAVKTWADALQALFTVMRPFNHHHNSIYIYYYISLTQHLSFVKCSFTRVPHFYRHKVHSGKINSVSDQYI